MRNAKIAQYSRRFTLSSVHARDGGIRHVYCECQPYCMHSGTKFTFVLENTFLEPKIGKKFFKSFVVVPKLP